LRERRSRFNILADQSRDQQALELLPMDEIESQFNAMFAHWRIWLPPKDIAQRRRGKIVRAGWAIWYLFGSDASGEYLDYYASHRMTNDRHVRIHADGRNEWLPSIEEFYLFSADPEENARLEAEYFAGNQRVAKLLEDKGFGLQGDEPGSISLFRYMRLHRSDSAFWGRPPDSPNKAEP
jgi:hypothetical protein